MKYKVLIGVVVVGIATMFFDFNKEAHGNGNGAPAGVTGSPSDGTTCANTGCHTGMAVAAETGWITSTIPVGGYVPGTVYSVTATATEAALSTFGFELSPQDAAGNQVGTLAAGTGTQLMAGTKYITHTAAGTIGTTGSHSWTFNWTAPPSGTGAFTFYGSFNCANGDTHSTGDHIHTSSLAITEAATAGIDCGVYAITPNFGCSGTYNPVVTIGNYGTTTLTSCTIAYQLDASAPSTFAWSGSLATGAKTTVTLPSVATTAGAHTFTAATVAPNSSTDVLNTNDSKTINITAFGPSIALPVTEGFESTTFPPTNWKLDNPDAPATTWVRSTSAHKTGVASAYMNNYSYSTGNAAIGQKDALVSVPIDLTTQIKPSMTFQVANAFYGAANTDTLKVLISTDCGATWTQLYKKWGTTLATGGTVTSGVFTPTAAQWRLETISLATYATATSALFRIVNVSGYGNSTYIDDINISGAAGIAELNNKPQLNLYPNPANDQLTLDYTLTSSSSVSIRLFDLQGREVAELVSEKNKAAGKYSTSMDTKKYNPGVYFVTIANASGVTTQKVVITR